MLTRVRSFVMPHQEDHPVLFCIKHNLSILLNSLRLRERRRFLASGGIAEESQMEVVDLRGRTVLFGKAGHVFGPPRVNAVLAKISFEWHGSPQMYDLISSSVFQRKHFLLREKWSLIPKSNTRS